MMRKCFMRESYYSYLGKSVIAPTLCVFGQSRF